MKIFCISDNTDTRTGLRLAGIPGLIVHSENELKEALNGSLNEQTAIILITEKLCSQFPAVVNEIRLNKTTPLIVEIPDRHGTGRNADFITEYIHRAIGLKI